MKRIVSSLLILGIWYASVSYAESIENNKPSFTRLDKIVAIVNREAITLSEFNKEMEKVKEQLEHRNEPVTEAAQLKKMVLDDLIAKTLQLQLCTSKNIKISDDELETTLQGIAKSNKINMDQFKSAVEQSGVKWDAYREEIRTQLMFRKVQQDEIAKAMSFTPEDVKKFMRENKDKLNQYDAYHIVDVVLPLPENAQNDQVEKIKKQAIDLSKQLQTTKDIDNALKPYPYAEKNDLGWRPLTDFPSLFQSKVAGMRINNTSAPIQAPNGFHVLKLLDARGLNTQLTENQIKGMAFQYKVNGELKNWLKKLRDNAYVQIMK